MSEPAAPAGAPVAAAERRTRLAATLVRDAAIAAIVLVLVGAFLVQPFRVQGDSMVPSLATGDRIIVSKVSYRVGAIERFDVVVLTSPEGRAVVKRVVGLPGERVAMEAGTVIVDGRPLHEAPARGCLEDHEEVVLGVDEYFVLGDNRAVSVDSRRFGPVPRGDIRGKAVLRYWPPGEAGSIAESE